MIDPIWLISAAVGVCLLSHTHIHSTTILSDITARSLILRPLILYNVNRLECYSSSPNSRRSPKPRFGITNPSAHVGAQEICRWTRVRRPRRSRRSWSCPPPRTSLAPQRFFRSSSGGNLAAETAGPPVMSSSQSSSQRDSLRNSRQSYAPQNSFK